jgi:hypothetical protein
MFTRLSTFTRADNIDEGVSYLRDKVLGVLRSQRGYRGVIASAARYEEVLGILTLWDTEADRQASDNDFGKAREEAAELVGGTLTIEKFEQVVAVVNEPPTVGSAFIMIRVSGDPAKTDDNVGFFESEILPRIKAAPGFGSVWEQVDRETGGGILCSSWRDQDALMRSTDEMITLRPEAAARGVNFGRTSFRDIVFADLR